MLARALFKLPTPALRSDALPGARAMAGVWREPIAKPRTLFGGYAFKFLNETHALPERGGWDEPSWEKLWRYNLHYFDDLGAADAHLREAMHRALLLRWIEENTPTHGTGWEPYPTS